MTAPLPHTPPQVLSNLGAGVEAVPPVPTQTGGTAELRFGAFEVCEGRVFDRGIYRPTETCERLLAVYRQAGAANDWWASTAPRLATDLADAMRAANQPSEIIQ